MKRPTAFPGKGGRPLLEDFAFLTSSGVISAAAAISCSMSISLNELRLIGFVPTGLTGCGHYTGQPPVTSEKFSSPTVF